MSIGHKAMVTAARALGAATVELALSPDVVKAARIAFEKKMSGKTYVSPLPKGSKPPLPEKK